MKRITLTLVLSLFIFQINAQDSTQLKLNPSKKIQIVEASCGQCNFKMAGKGCTLAVRIKGKAYFVDKAHIDAFGDAHSKMGFCNAIRKAKVQGEIVNNKFVATYFELIDKNK
jgi:hypothetical protein